jgi:hypothetical protein
LKIGHLATQLLPIKFCDSLADDSSHERTMSEEFEEAVDEHGRKSMPQEVADHVAPVEANAGLSLHETRSFRFTQKSVGRPKIYILCKQGSMLRFFKLLVFEKIVIITLVFEKNANLFAENCDHNIDPRS